jgi:Zn-dependent peptidase ImmA (M78 family)
MSEEVCRQRAREVLQEQGITAPPVDVETVVRAYGLEVEYVTKGRGFNGRLLKERMVIEVEAHTHPHRQRFTIAHELGHYLLGHSPVFCVFDDRDTSDPRRINEYQANIFASELLMPDAWIRERWRELTDVQAMARAFYVSPEAMFRRLDAAGLLGLELPL